jgi:hypothetical protein
VDGERDATKQEISLAERPRGKRLIAPRTTVTTVRFPPFCSSGPRLGPFWGTILGPLLEPVLDLESAIPF